MVTLTKKKTIEEHRKMWNWIADQLEKPSKTIKTVAQLKEQYCDIHDVAPMNSCFCCAYANQIAKKCDPIDKEDCIYCPLIWDSDMTEYMCEDKEEKYDSMGLWMRANDLSSVKFLRTEAALIARQIANLPERPDKFYDILS